MSKSPRRRSLVALIAVSMTAALLVSSTPVSAAGAPSRPARPTATADAHDAVTVSWTDPGDASITGYRILRRNKDITPRQPFQIIADDIVGTSYTDTTVEAETTYAYRIKARNSAGYSRRSRPAAVETPSAPVIEENLDSSQDPVELTLRLVSSNDVVVEEGASLSHQMEASLDGAQGDVTYHFEGLYNEDDHWDSGLYDWDWDYLNLSSSGELTSFDVLDYESSVPADSYSVEVTITATTDTDEFSIVETINITIADVAEPTVSNVRVTGQSDSTVSVSWDRMQDADHYMIWVHESATETSEAKNITHIYTTRLRHTVDRLKSGTSHDFNVLAVTCTPSANTWWDICTYNDATLITHSTD